MCVRQSGPGRVFTLRATRYVVSACQEIDGLSDDIGDVGDGGSLILMSRISWKWRHKTVEWS